MRALGLIGLLGSVALLACANSMQPAAREASDEVQRAGGKGESTAPRVNAAGGPLETAPPNVPEFKPAFPEQTRAPAMRTETPLRVSEVASGLEMPWALEFLPDGRMLVTEKHAGRLRLLSSKGETLTSVVNVPEVDAGGQGGLMDVILGPDYATTRTLYLSYYEPREGGGNGLAVARATLVEGAPPRLDSVQVLFRMQPAMKSDKHAGGRLVFAPDGHLLIMLGDRSILEGRHQARDLNSHSGKVVRIRPDGSVPQDNPFVGRSDAKPEIWSLGHRNVLAADLDARGRLWVVEMGPRGGDELNLVERGKDYGWPTIGYGEEYSGDPIHESPVAAGLEQPVYYWDPVISPGALTIYSGDLIKEWQGDFLIAGLSSQALVRLRLRDDRVEGEERLLTDRDERIREVVQGPEGAVYLLTDGRNGSLLRLTPEHAR